MNDTTADVAVINGGVFISDRMAALILIFVMFVSMAFLFSAVDVSAQTSEASYTHQSDGLRYLIPTGVYRFLEIDDPDCPMIIITQIDDNFGAIIYADDGSQHGPPESWRKLDQPIPIQICPQPNTIIIEKTTTFKDEGVEASVGH